jgi:hypothetical protein
MFKLAARPTGGKTTRGLSRPGRRLASAAALMTGDTVKRSPIPSLMLVSTGLAIASVGCDAADTPGDAPDRVARAAVIVAPADADTVDGPSVRIELATENVAVRPAGTEEPGSGHHHLFVNRDLTPLGETIPAESGIIHLGGAQTEHTLEDLAPGTYTVIAVLGDYQHVRLDAKTDTVRFTVRGEM